MSEEKERKWVQEFKKGLENVHDESRSGQLLVVFSDDLVSALDAKISDDRRFKITNKLLRTTFISSPT